MQPLLVYLSRLWEFLSEKDNFWQAMMDPFNRMRVSRKRDPRNEKSKFFYPVLTFTDRPHEHSEGRHPYVDRFREKIHGPDATMDLLEDSLRFYVISGNHVEGWPDGAAADGVTGVDDEPRPLGSRTPYHIKTLIAVENLYPLLHDGYSKSEKMMVIHQVATTVLHEIAHAVNYAHHIFLHTPGPHVILQGRHARACDKLEAYGRWLYGPASSGDALEPMFDDDYKAELGFAMENAIFGGSVRSMTDHGVLRFNHLGPMPSGLHLEPWPPGGVHDADEAYEDDDSDASQQKEIFLRESKRPINSFHMNLPWPEVAAMQTQEFWDVQVDKFGSAALRLAPNANTKSHNARRVNHLDRILSNESTDKETLDAFQTVMSMPMPAHSEMIVCFLRIQIAEAMYQETVQPRWKAEMKAMTRRMRKLGAIHCLLQLYGRAAKWQYDCSKTGPPEEWASEDGTHPASVYCVRAYQEFRALMTKFRKIAGKHQKSDDAGSRPRWLPPKLAEGIKNPAHLRDNLVRLFHEGLLQLLPLARQTFHMATEIIIVAEGFLAELWTLDPQGQALALSGRFRKDMQRVFVDTLVRSAEAVDMALEAAELDLELDGFVAKALATRQKLTRLVPIFRDLENVPNNAVDLLACVPHLMKSRRLTSERWLRTAQRELQCLTAVDQQRALQVINWLKDRAHQTAMKVPKPDLPGKSETEGMAEWDSLMSSWVEARGMADETRPLDQPLFPHAPGFIGTGQLGEPRPEAGQFTVTAAKRRRSRDAFGNILDHDDEPAFKKRKTGGPRLALHLLKNLPTLQDLAPENPWYRLPDVPLAEGRPPIKLLSPEQRGKKRPNLMHSKSFADGAHSSYSDRSTDSPFRGLSTAPQQQPWQDPGPPGGQNVPARAEAARPLFGGGRHVEAPATRGMFPHPYALNATTTDDLALLPAAAPRPPADFRAAMFSFHRSPERKKKVKKQRAEMQDPQALSPGEHYGLRRDMRPAPASGEKEANNEGNDADDEGGPGNDGGNDSDSDRGSSADMPVVSGGNRGSSEPPPRPQRPPVVQDRDDNDRAGWKVFQRMDSVWSDETLPWTTTDEEMAD